MARLITALGVLLLTASCSTDTTQAGGSKAGPVTKKAAGDDDDSGSGSAARKQPAARNTPAKATAETDAGGAATTVPPGSGSLEQAPNVPADDSGTASAAAVTTAPVSVASQTTQPPATQPSPADVFRGQLDAVINGKEVSIYRCRYTPPGSSLHHYFTMSSACEGAPNMQLDGHVFTAFQSGSNGCSSTTANIAQVYRALGSNDPGRTYLKNGWVFYTLCQPEQPDYLATSNLATGWGFLAQFGGVNQAAYAQVIQERGLVPLYRFTASTPNGPYFFYATNPSEGQASGFGAQQVVGYVKP